MAVRALIAFLFVTAASAAERRLILHADDLGFSHAANRASIEMLEKGYVSSASIMMPCPWVPEIAAWARTHPEKDLGLHFTLTSEWKTMRWGPVASRDKVPGLLDPDGYMWMGVADVASRATPQEIELELRAQIEKAKTMGIRFTHFDTHMGTLYARPDYFAVFEKLGREYGVPILRIKPSEDSRRNAPKATVDYILSLETKYQQEGTFRLDSLLADPTGGEKDYQRRRELYQKGLRAMPPGTHMLILHPAIIEEELKASTNTAIQRDGDYRTFSDPATVQLIKDLGIQLVGWKDVAPMAGAKTK